MVKVILRERKIHHILFGISVIVGFILSWYWNNPILLILSTVYSVVLYLVVPRYETKTGQQVAFTKTFTADVVLARLKTLTARSEKALKAKITNYKKTHQLSDDTLIIETIEKEGYIEYSVVLRDITPDC